MLCVSTYTSYLSIDGTYMFDASILTSTPHLKRIGTAVGAYTNRITNRQLANSVHNQVTYLVTLGNQQILQRPLFGQILFSYTVYIMGGHLVGKRRPLPRYISA